MQTDKWKKIKEILGDVLSLEPSARRSFLDNAGLSEEIRAEVESLLAFETEAKDSMRLSAIEFTRDFFDNRDEKTAFVGQDFGVYRVVSELGYGGMGAVYLAERTDGKFEQKVALKVLKREMNTAALRRRFQQEREILASLEHPNIARLLDAGTTDDGIPYLAMEYVEGLPIDDFCNKNKLELNQRLDLFRKVCAAVNFAHRNLVVHRDLKPSNILVTGDEMPKLLDFGISKFLSEDFEQVNSATVTKLGAMTPGYASPEQLQHKSVTTATDIYSLGVILYEILSGHRPFETKENDLKEIYHAVVESEAPPPSALVDTIAKEFKKKTEAKTEVKQLDDFAPATKIAGFDARTEAVKFRRTMPQSIRLNSSSLRGDLDNIVLKALRKEPERRYSSAENFAEDIRRHQQGLPVSARPNTFSYRAGKFIKRNRASVTAAALIVLAIIGGIAATLWQARAAQAERVRAEKRFNDVRKLANSYLFDVYPEIEMLEGSLKAREKIVQNALEYLDSLSQEAGDDLELQRELAKAYEKVGDVQGAMNVTNQGDINAGLESYRKAQRLREAVYAAAPNNAEIKEDLAKTYQIIAQTLWWNNDTAGAEDYFEKAVKLRRELAAADPSSIILQNRLAVLLLDHASIPMFNVQNEKASALIGEAENLLREILKNTPDHFLSQRALARALRNFSTVMANMGDFDGAIRNLDQSVAITDALIRQKPDDYVLKRTGWLNQITYCEIYVTKRDGENAVESCLKAVDFNAKALEKEPDESAALNDLAITYYNIARGYRFSNNPNAAIEYAQKAIETMSKLDKIAPGTNDYVRGIAVYQAEIADSLLTLGQREKALEHLRKSQMALEKVVEKDNKVTTYQMDLAKTYQLLAKAHNKKGEKAKAAEFIDKAIFLVARLKEQENLRDSDKNLPEELEREKAEYTA